MLVSSFVLAAAALPGDHVGAQSQAATASKAGVTPTDLILGEWWTERNQGRVRITRDKDGTFRGTTTCCVHKNDPDNPDIDKFNPKPELRTRTTLGIVIFWKLQYDDGEFVDGYVYNPRDGKTYRIDMKIIDRDTIKIRGYVGISLLGQSQFWKRANGPKTSAPTASR
jgi:uncharacterized protein (DUF2147 family)